MVLNGVFYALQKYGTDQTIVQRYLAAKSDKEAKKAAYIGVLMSVPIWALFMFIGTALFAYYHAHGAPLLPEGIKADEVFPYFIAHELPVGIRGLIIAALAAAAISSLDSDLNCLSAIAVQDYYMRFHRQATDRQQLRFGRWMVVVAGVGAIVHVDAENVREPQAGIPALGGGRFARADQASAFIDEAGDLRHQRGVLPGVAAAPGVARAAGVDQHVRVLQRTVLHVLETDEFHVDR